MTDFFTSDLHFGHVRILGLTDRGKVWSTLDEMNEGLIDNWNSIICPGDRVYVLGDVCMGKFVETIELVRRLKGEKWLIPGNHDRVHPMYRDRRPAKRVQWQMMYEAVFDVVCNAVKGNFLQYNLGPAVVPLSHFPYEADRLDRVEYDDWRPPDLGGWLLHGHVHEEWWVKGKQINVGTDVWGYRPVAAHELAALIKERETSMLDGFGKGAY